MNQIKYKLDLYNKHFFNLNLNLSIEENLFINKCISNIDDKDIFINEHISAYTFCPSVDKSGLINYGRFAFGKKTKDKYFYSLVEELFNFLNINIYNSKDNFFYYGVGWDYLNNLIKFYQLSSDYTNIYCEEFLIDRANFKNNYMIKSKEYAVGVYNTIMNKDDSNINQINLNNNSKVFDNSHANDLCDKMKSLDFLLDTYSIYNNKTTLYFD